MWHILVDCTCFVSLASNQMVEKTEQDAGDGLGKAVPLLEGSIWPIVFSFIIVFRLSLPSHSALRYNRKPA